MPSSPAQDLAHAALKRHLDVALAELRLLLGFFEARSDRSLASGFQGSPPVPPPEQTKTEQTFLEKWAQVQRKPDEVLGNDADLAWVFAARDFLNGLAAPACGMSVAYSSLVAESHGVAPDLQVNGTLAALRRSARVMRWFRTSMVFALFGILLVAIYLSCHAILGTRILQRIDQANAARTAVGAEIQRVEAALTPAGAPPEGMPGHDAAPPRLTPRFCDQPALWVRPGPALPADLFYSPAQGNLCDRLRDADRKGSIAFEDLGDWLKKWRPLAEALGMLAHRDGADLAASEQFAGSILHVIGVFLLPAFYGFIGAGLYVLRALSAKTYHGELLPRDLQNSLLRVVLGTVMGACIGLFFQPDGTAVSGAAGVADEIKLSVAAIALLAGFGVEAVFRLLEGLVNALFRVAEGAARPTPEPVRQLRSA